LARSKGRLLLPGEGERVMKESRAGGGGRMWVRCCRRCRGRLLLLLLCPVLLHTLCPAPIPTARSRSLELRSTGPSCLISRRSRSSPAAPSALLPFPVHSSTPTAAAAAFRSKWASRGRVVEFCWRRTTRKARGGRRGSSRCRGSGREWVEGVGMYHCCRKKRGVRDKEKEKKRARRDKSTSA
jgi:hypothetical protein